MPTSSKTPSTSSAQSSAAGAKMGPSPAQANAAALHTTIPSLLQSGIFDQLHDAVFTTGLDGTITSCNQAVSRYGYSTSALIGKNIADFYGMARPIFFADWITPAVERGRIDGELHYRAQGSEEICTRLCLTLLRNSEETAVGLIAVSIETSRGMLETASAKQTTKECPTPLTRRSIDGTSFLIASPIMHKFMGMVDRVAGHTETVLVTGETGTGKELVARTIHESSSRRKQNLVDINCAALPEHLVESELLGYEKGAFSGADSSKPGLFELADKSTIFLDEIGELQPQIQVKLLRVLDGAPYYRLGGNRKISVDVRVVAATNQDLELAVKEGRFRKDLFHRLGQFQLRVPPLRERPEDIAALARHFLSLKTPGKTFATDALSVLQAHTWPGNIRELRNLVAKLAMASSDGQITASQIKTEFHGAHVSTSEPVRTLHLGNLDSMEEQMIIRALERTGGHRSQAAEQLGISRRTLSRKLREYGIDVPTGEGTSKLGNLSDDQQKFFRAKVNVAVTLRNAKGHELQAQAVNLSTGGMGLDAVGDAMGFTGLLDASFLLPESEIEIHAKGRIVWTEAGGRAGLRFVVVEPALFEQLQHWTNQKMKDEGWELAD